MKKKKDKEEEFEQFKQFSITQKQQSNKLKLMIN